MIGRLVAVATVCVALVGCDPHPGKSAASGPVRTTTSTAPRPAVVVDARPGWTEAGVDGRRPSAGTCRFRSDTDGSALPDPVCTPGATDPSMPTRVSLDVIYGLASTDRDPPPGVRAAAEAAVFAAYAIPAARRQYFTLDTLIPPALGGSWAYENLWPVPTGSQFAPNRSMRDPKDVITAYLRDAVVRHLCTVPAVAHALAHDWPTAVAALHLPSIPDSYSRGG